MTTIHDLAIELQRRGYWTEVTDDPDDPSGFLNIWDVTGEYKLSGNPRRGHRIPLSYPRAI